MLINFLKEHLKPKVSCSVPATDGYEVTNLISNDSQKSKKGFLAYPCMRTPVDIDFELICSVNIHHIVIWPAVGNQKSTEFEILAATGSTDSYQSISPYMKKNNAHGIICYNGRDFQRRIKVCVPDNFSACPLKASQWRLITSCSKLKVRILKTENSVPCIGKVEMWGYVSKRCCHLTKKTVIDLHAADRRSVAAAAAEADADGAETPSGELLDSGQAGEPFAIPEEFLDAITFEVMNTPMTLPSGNTVDKSTVEKHNVSQEVWARAPHDPFTGTPFTDTAKPEFNFALKRRLDLFCVAHKDREEIKSLARTLGRGPAPAPATTPAETPAPTSRKRPLDAELGDPPPPPPPDRAEPPAENNLDLALNKAISKLKRYSQMPPPEPTAKKCCTCNAEDNLYILKCQHFLCRSCISLNFTDAVKCRLCNVLYRNRDVLRYHH